MAPPGVQTELSELVNQVTAWREDVVAFASEADLKLGTTQMGPRDFLPQPSYSSGGSSAELAVRNAQYKLNVAQAQLRASRENSAVATEKLLEVTGQLGDIMAQIAGLDVQKQNVSERKLSHATMLNEVPINSSNDTVGGNKINIAQGNRISLRAEEVFEQPCVLLRRRR